MSDYIKREDAINAIADMMCFETNAETSGTCTRADFIDDAKDWLSEAQTADVAPIRHGHWIYDCCDIVCSECGTAFSDEVCYMMRGDASYHEPRHCLWCGAEMSEDTEY